MTPRGAAVAASCCALVLLASCTSGRPPTGAGHTAAPTPSAASVRPTPSPSSTGNAPAPAAALRPFYTQRLTWRGCRDGFECTSVQVPVDYARPAAGRIALSVVRLPARDRSRRIGSLLVNPGGPGISGIGYARQADTAITDPVRARYDIVGFDPRGVGRSAPVRCQDDAQTDAWVAADGSPDDAAEERRYDALARALAQRCARRGGALLRHMGTVDAARDLDVLRAVLGDRQLYYLGKSYGTYLGAVYAEEFPRNVGRLVLDGAKDPRLDADAEARGQAQGFELALSSFVADCVRRTSCPLGRDRRAAYARLDRFLADVDRTPLRVGGRRLTQGLALLGVALPLYDKNLWPFLRTALGRGLDGKGALLLASADAYSQRQPNGHYADNSNDAIYAVNCVDRADTSTLAHTRALAAALARLSPRFGAYIAWGDRPCVGWPAPPTGRPRAITAAGAAPILVVGTIRDPATPYAWAQGLAQQLASGVLLTWDGDGHTAYAQGSDCIDAAVEGYLLDGRPPADGTRCR